MDVVKEDMKSVGVKEEDAEDRVGWRQTIGCGHFRRKQEGKEKKDTSSYGVGLQLRQMAAARHHPFARCNASRTLAKCHSLFFFFLPKCHPGSYRSAATAASTLPSSAKLIGFAIQCNFKTNEKCSLLDLGRKNEQLLRTSQRPSCCVRLEAH